MEEKKKYKAIELRSEEVQEIMSQIPSWIVRWGITVLFIVVAILLVGSYFFKYPDVLSAEITITAEEPPVNIIARTSGKLDTVFVKNQDLVKEETPLAVIQNPANTSDVLTLIEKLEVWKEADYSIKKGKEIFQNEPFNLGVIQNAYANFLSSLRDYTNYKELNYFTKKIEVLKQQLLKQKEYYDKVSEQQELVEGKQVLSDISFERDSVLYAKGIISKVDYEGAKKTLLQEKQSEMSFSASLKQTELQLIHGQESLLDLQQRAMEAEQKYTLSLHNNKEALIAQLEAWKQQNLLVSPIRGVVNEMGVWSHNQSVNSGDVVFIIKPEESSDSKGTALLPVQGAGKVRIGQRVNVRVNNFPDQEFGYLEGKVVSISSSPTSEGFYILTINFPKGLRTNYNKELPKTGEMKGIAEIITEDLRLIERFFMPIKKILKDRL